MNISLDLLVVFQGLLMMVQSEHLDWKLQLKVQDGNRSNLAPA